MTIEKIIHRVLHLYAKGVPSRSIRLSSREIFNKLESVRAVLLKQKITKKQALSPLSYVTIACLPNKQALPYECPCIPPVGCMITRTKDKLPGFLMGINGPMIQSVTSLDGFVSYSPTTWDNKKYKKAAKYTSNNPDYYIRNEFMYFTHKIPKRVSITYIPSSLEEYYVFKDNCGVDDEDCTPIYEREFLIDADLIEPLIQMTIAELVIQFSQGAEDITNDSTDTNKMQNRYGTKTN